MSTKIKIQDYEQTDNFASILHRPLNKVILIRVLVNMSASDLIRYIWGQVMTFSNCMDKVILITSYDVQQLYGQSDLYY